MKINRSTNWFLTETGRRFSFGVVTSTSIALTAVRFCPNTFFIKQYKNFVHQYDNGIPVELPKEIQNRYQTCLKLLKVVDSHKKLIQPFSVFGFDLFNAGSTNFKFGVVIGIPTNFTFKNFEDIEKRNIQVNQKTIDLSSETGKKLGESLILSEKCQEFAICREILMTQNNKVMFESTYPFMCILFMYTLSQYINRKFNLYAAPIQMRGILYSILGFFGAGTYFLMKDVTQVYYEVIADKKLSEFGIDYVKSGVEFYEKLLNRNQALRELMGAQGERKYTKLGNENYGLRQPHLALVHRKKFFEEKLKALNDDLENMTL